jgi:DNA helicase-2/ATP-dependent DNA helicase PcrA
VPVSRIAPATPSRDSTGEERPVHAEDSGAEPRAVSAGEERPAPPVGGREDKRGTAAFLERTEVRDVLAWMRLLVDPQDAAAVVRALARPPIELRQVDLARVIQLARRRKLDMVAALAAAIESPQVPPDARERIQRFLELHQAAEDALDVGRPDLLVRVVLGAEGRDREESETDDGPAHALQQTLRMMREEVLASVARIGGRLGELRLDTDLDISHGVVRYLELLKLAALAQRPEGQSVAEALADINARLLAATTALEREIFQTSSLDETLIDPGSVGERSGVWPAKGVIAGVAGQDDARVRAQAIAPREASSLGPFLPRKGIGLALSASDIETYRGCPLRYKFARVLRIPTEQTLHQRFGIAVHQVLERYHSERSETLAQLLDLLYAAWRKGGFGESAQELDLREKARVALTRYHARLHGQESKPVWFERPFAFRLGPHHLRGRVDRVDRLGEGSEQEYELIDYKTGRPRTAEQLSDDIQLSLYALAAREAWQLESSSQAYYYVLDDLKVPVPRDKTDAESVKDIVLAVGEGILAQQFDPTPSRAACSICDYRIVCPAAEK